MSCVVSGFGLPRLCREAEQGESWIFEGGHSSTWPSRLARAEMLVWVDRPVGIRLWRLLKRAVVGLGRTRSDMVEDCPERLRSLPEFVGYIWTTRNSGAAKIAMLAARAAPNCKVIHLQSDEEVAKFVEGFDG